MTEVTDEIEFESIGDLNRRDKEWNFTVLTCPEVWTGYYSDCRPTDEWTWLYYDANSCGNIPVYIPVPVDNGTIEACNYCTIDYHWDTGDCTDFKLYNETYYDNYETCCAVTNITEDCELPSPIYLQTCTGIHSSNSITGLAIDIPVGIGQEFIRFAPLIAIIVLAVGGLAYLGIKRFW
jgi:hypothetical protein